jgi:uncharacterized protein (TIGR03086 family)
MAAAFDAIADRFAISSQGFERRLTAVRPVQWSWPTPCTGWSVRDLVNHMARGNLSYARLFQGGTAAEFVAMRDEDALGTDPAGAFARSVRACAAAFAVDGVPGRMVDYPLGVISGRQALAVRATDSTVHTWDLARAIGADEHLDEGLVAWISAHLHEIYDGLPETPVAADTTHRFFAPPRGAVADDASRQDRLLHLMGRTP